MRWLHIYLSMFGLAAVLFFSVTGITLNHPDWVFGQVERKREAEGQVDVKWIGREAARLADTEADPTSRSRSWKSSSTCGRRTRSAVPWRSSASMTPNAWCRSKDRATPRIPSSIAIQATTR